jgi:regulator of protease activity HflC (stomatin/prohibitin superfamily)
MIEKGDLMFNIVILISILLVLLIISVKITKHNERLVLFRLGKYMGIRGPGIIIIIPIIDFVVRVDLDLNISNWKLLSKEELEDKLKSIVISVEDKILRK